MSNIEFRKFKISEIDQAPESAGIYAWYPVVQIGVPDWQKVVDISGNDAGEANFRALLAKHSVRFQPPPLRLSASGSFRDNWNGKLLPDRYDRHVVNFRDGNEHSERNVQFPAKEIANVLKAEGQRGRMAALIGAMNPVFSAPLYIGKSDNLNKRLKEHFVDLDKWSQVARKNPGNREMLRKALFEGAAQESVPDIFATRAVACGFAPESLEVYVLDVAKACGVGRDAARDLSCALEWMLNTWNRPIFGRV